MTREEARKYLLDISNSLGKTSIEYLTEKDENKMREAIKTLEQEPILDKIRDEIWDLQFVPEEKSMTNEDRADAYNNAINQVIEIIDKYKAESEDKV